MRYDGAIMMARTQVSLEPELRGARGAKRAGRARRLVRPVRGELVAVDLDGAEARCPAAVFALGARRESDVAATRDALLGAAVEAERRRPRNRRP
jgi:hypothetical protein